MEWRGSNKLSCPVLVLIVITLNMVISWATGRIRNRRPTSFRYRHNRSIAFVA